MSEPYTPTTDEVRAVWREWNNYGGLTNRTTPEPPRSEMQQEFDRWLAGVKAEAWDEGAEAFALNVEHATGPKDEVTNPYRRAEQ